jgi:glycosyltransferase involved in cell wall biosynthesis
MKQSSSIIIGKYRLEPLLHIRQDDLSGMLGSMPGVYICDCAEPEWYKHFGFKQTDGVGHIEKKCHMFLQMAKGSKWVSPTSDVPKGKKTHTWENGDILHLGYKSFHLRFNQILQTISLFGWLLRRRKEYDYCLVYNFYLPIYLAPLIMKYLLKKPLYVDYEDDYTKQRKNLFKNFLERLMRHTVTGAICINEYMVRYFTKKQARVLNAFADLEYTESIEFNLRDGMTFLFSGTLDKIRGIELIPDLRNALRQHIKNFRILITGNGPLKSLVQSWSYPEVKYLGFLNYDDYLQTIKQSDACLVLQKPDHPFSLGSFPSKVDEYAKYKKPIFMLKEYK